MNWILIFTYIEEIAQAGPDAMVAVKDVMRAVNDLRAGKITQADTDAVIDDFKKIVADLLGGIKLKADNDNKTTTVVTTTTAAPTP